MGDLFAANGAVTIVEAWRGSTSLSSELFRNDGGDKPLADVSAPQVTV
jgi:hypothetical protein